MNMYEKFNLSKINPVRIYGEIRTEGYTALRRTRVTRRYTRKHSERSVYKPGTLPGLILKNIILQNHDGEPIIIDGFTIKRGMYYVTSLDKVGIAHLIAVGTSTSGFPASSLAKVWTRQSKKPGVIPFKWDYDWVDVDDDDPVVANLAKTMLAS